MFNHNKLLVAAVGATAALGSGGASAVEFQTSDWTFSATGNVNVHYIYTSCDDSGATVLSGLLCNSPPPAEDTASSVTVGLLPAAIVFGAATTQNDVDIGATIGFYPGVVSNDFGPSGPNIVADGGISRNTALATTNLDIRQVFLTFGNESWGTFKLGRDFGLYGFDAIINDMTIPGVGVASVFTATSPANTTLGSIGFGYIYTDTPAQINYETPSLGGFVGTVGIFNPWDAVNLSGVSASTASNVSPEPGYHGKLSYAWEGGAPGFVSISGISQEVVGLTAPTGSPAITDTTERGWAADATAKVTFAGLDLLGSYYIGEGWGTTAHLFDAFDAAGEKRDSDGFLGQVTYTIGSTKFGVNYGQSNLDANAIDPGELLDKHSKITGGVYHNLTPNLTLLAEFTDAEAENNAGGDVSTWNANVGAFLAF